MAGGRRGKRAAIFDAVQRTGRKRGRRKVAIRPLTRIGVAIPVRQWGMDREQVIAALRRHEKQLRAAGVIRVSLFGSTARGDARPDSDVDLLAAFDSSRRLSLLDVAGIERQISQALGRPVELIEEGTLKPRVRRAVEAEAVRAF